MEASSAGEIDGHLDPEAAGECRFRLGVIVDVVDGNWCRRRSSSRRRRRRGSSSSSGGWR